MSGIVDKRGRLATLSSGGPIVLELGCGERKRRAEAIGIDAIDYDSVDVVGDIFDVLAAIPDEAVDEIYSSHFVEHLPDLERLVRELRRVLKVGGRVLTIAPHFSNPYFYSDYTHRAMFGLYTFSYLATDRIYTRRVPHYVKDSGFELLGARLVFKAPRPFYLRHAWRKLVQIVVNSSVVMQECYEGGWCFLLPCYEVEYLVVKRH